MTRRRPAFDRLLDALRDELPPKKPVRVRIRPLADADGLTEIMPSGNFRITINANAGQQRRIDALCHEWAHTLAWNENEDHGPRWGEATGKVENIRVKVQTL